MSVNILKTSRLQLSTLRSVNGVEFWEPPDSVTIPVNSDDISYVVQDNDRIDLLAYNFYQNPSLWWVIAYANDIRLPSVELVRGMTLRIPSGSYVFGTLLGK